MQQSHSTLHRTVAVAPTLFHRFPRKRLRSKPQAVPPRQHTLASADLDTKLLPATAMAGLTSQLSEDVAGSAGHQKH